MGRETPFVDFIRGFTAERRVRSMLIVPLSDGDQLTSERLPAKRDQRYLAKHLLQCQDESFDDGDAAVPADRTVSRRWMPFRLTHRRALRHDILEFSARVLAT